MNDQEQPPVPTYLLEQERLRGDLERQLAQATERVTAAEKKLLEKKLLEKKLAFAVATFREVYLKTDRDCVVLRGAETQLLAAHRLAHEALLFLDPPTKEEDI